MVLADLMDRTFYHNSTRTWLVFGGVIVLVVGAMLVLRLVIIRRLTRLAQRTATGADDLAVDLLRRVRLLFFVAVALAAASRLLTLPDDARVVLRLSLVLVVLVQGAVWANGAIAFWVRRYTGHRTAAGASITTVVALGYAARVLLWTLILLLALDNLGVQLTTIVAGLGVTGIAVALAVQNILGDLFGALSIVIDKPFVVGDSIGVDEFNGDVEHIGLKTTRIRSMGGEQLVISNKDLLESRIRNYKRMSRRRVALTFGVVRETSPEDAARVPAMVRAVVESVPRLRFDRAHLVGMGSSSLDFEVVYYVETPDYLVHMDAQQSVLLEILRRLRAQGIALAYPTRRVLMEGAGESMSASPASPVSTAPQAPRG